MISSIFGKTKPVNFIIVLGFIFLFYWLVQFFIFPVNLDFQELIYYFFVLGVLLFSVFVVDFIAKRNQITGTNSFTILFYALLIVVFPEVLLDPNAIFCNFFLLLAFRRILSLKSLKNVKHKVFDASIWILIASFWYDWALIFLLLVYIAIYFYEPKIFKNWLVPIGAFIIISLITYAALIILDKVEFLQEHYQFEYIPDFKNHLADYTKIGIYTLLALVISSIAFIRMSKLGMGKIITMRLIAVALGLGLTLTFLKTSEISFPVLITFFSTSIFLTKYVELTKKSNYKELFLIASVLLPFLILSIELILK